MRTWASAPDPPSTEQPSGLSQTVATSRSERSSSLSLRRFLSASGWSESPNVQFTATQPASMLLSGSSSMPAWWALFIRSPAVFAQRWMRYPLMRVSGGSAK